MRTEIHSILAERYAHHTKRLREKQRLPRAALASVMGISEEYLKQLEIGFRKPSREMIELTARALDVDPSALLKEVKS